MRGAALQALRHAFDLDRSAIGNQVAGKGSGKSVDDGRAGDSAAKSDAGESAGFGVYSAEGISGGSGSLRGLVEGRVELSEQERVSGRIARGSGGAVYAGEWGDFCADTDCVFAGDSGGGFV